MDVNLLLNAGSRADGCRPSIENPASSSENVQPNPKEAALVSSPEGESASVEGSGSRSRTPWSAGGYALPRRAESISKSTPTYSPASPRDSLGSSSILERGSRTRSLSRHRSTDSSTDVGSPRRHSTWIVTEPSRRVSTTDRSQNDTQNLFNRKTSIRDDYGAYIRDTIAESKHRLSMSNISLSSFGSSQSGYHSRLSSVTTVSGSSNSGVSSLDMPLIESKLPEYHESLPDFEDDIAYSPLSSLPEENSPPTSGESEGTERPRSPSDAVLNLKGLVKPLLDTRNHRRGQIFITRPKFHKRAISAPVFAPRSTPHTSNTLKHRHPVLPQPQIITDKSFRRRLPAEMEDSVSAVDMNDQRAGSEQQESAPHQVSVVENEAPSRPATLSPPLPSESLSPPKISEAITTDNTTGDEAVTALPSASLGSEPSCMFVEDCRTGSQLRKAISHLFGRNKACTLRIPKQVWVYYCRKHYQRIRYRNAKTYPLTQMSLVRTQIERLQAWSDDNQRNKNGPFIRFWTLSLRKREQNRLEKEGGADDGEEEVESSQKSAAAVPDWLVERLGTGYTTEQILEVADRLHEEIEQGNLNQIPEIEFLPDITDPEEGTLSRPIRGRKQPRQTSEVRAPKRKADEAQLTLERIDSDSSFWQEEQGQSMNSVAKRPRQEILHGFHRRRSSVLPPPSATTSTPVDAFQVPSDRNFASFPRHFPMDPRHESYDYDYASHGRSIHGHPTADFHRNPSLGSPYDQQLPPNFQLSEDAGPSFPGRRNNEQGKHRRLPSISAQIPEHFDFHGHGPARSFQGFHDTGFGLQGPPRSSHHRSASAFTPVSQPGHAFIRPTSPGRAPEAAMTPFKNRRHGPSAYEHNHAAYSREQWQEPEYGFGPAPAHGYSSGFTPSQHSYRPGSFYDHAVHHPMNPAMARTQPDARRSLEGPQRGLRLATGSDAWQRAEQTTEKKQGETRET